ncbi:hypothetical protein B0J17DRAFT_674362 [Rhizoctonia solani]|nr:hypothetical protein B0J17DRAFT_674362 [Rhizoctonia solani]
MTRPLLITSLPNEVLVRILHYCKYRAIIRFSMTCRKSYEAVLQSISLQLLIGLEVTGLEILDISSKASYSSVLAELKGYQDAWQNFRLSPVVQSPVEIPLALDIDWELRNGAYIGGFRESNKEYPGDNQFDRIQVIHLHSPVVPPPLDFKKKFNNSMVDISQDLVVLVEYFQESPSSVIANVHLHHVTTGLPHSLAQLSTFTIRDENLRSSSTDLVVMGSILAITFAGPESSVSGCCDTLIWDWRSCHLIGRIKSESNDADITFLDKGHLLVFSALPSPSQEPNQVALLFYAIPNSPTSNQEPPQADVYVPSCPKIEPVLVLEFPKLYKTYQIQGYVLASMPLLGDLAYRGSAKVVYSRTTTIALQFWTELIEHMVGPNDGRPPKYIDYCVFVNTDCIFDHLLENTAGETMKIPWSQWGTEATRWFIDKDSLSASSINAFGSQYPIWDFDPDNADQRLSIFEFNPQVVRRYINTSRHREEQVVAGGSCLSSRSVFGIYDLKAPLLSAYNANMGQHVVTDVIGSDTKTIIDQGFAEPVESSLPYMVVTRVECMPRHAAWYIQGDYLVGIPVTEPGSPHPPLSLYKLQCSQGD